MFCLSTWYNVEFSGTGTSSEKAPLSDCHVGKSVEKFSNSWLMWEGPAPCRVGVPEWCKKAGQAKNVQASKQAYLLLWFYLVIEYDLRVVRGNKPFLSFYHGVYYSDRNSSTT